MLTQLATIKTRLGIDPTDVTNDDALTFSIEAVSARFDRECKRTFARTVDAIHEFEPSDLELSPPCYPIESVTRFELITSDEEGWVEQPDVRFILRRKCVIALGSRLGALPQFGRVTYTGGYVLPGNTIGAGQTALPADLESAAIETVAFW